MSNATFPTWTIGDLSVTALSDGYLNASLGLLSNIEEVDASRIQKQAGVADPDAIHINCYLVRGAGETS